MHAYTIVLLLAGCATMSAPSDPIDSLFADYACKGCAGASVAIVDGESIIERAYGLADVSAGARVTVKTNFRLASLSKQFTAMAVWRLVQDGALHLDDRLDALVPGLPAWAHDIQLVHLLSHSSGVWDYEDFVTGPEQVHDRDMPALLAHAGRTYFPPGTAHRYSNSAYALLALIVERTSGKSFATFLHERVFGPAGMNNTVAFESGISTVANRALGTPADQSPTSAVLGDGGVYSSIVDLAAWYRGLKPPPLSPELSAPYAFGWFVDDDGGRVRLTHHGETCGFTNAVVRYPAHNLTVIVLTNRRGSEPWRIAQRIADLRLGLAAREVHWPFLSMPSAH
jgi:CubicO group peptidase (beta-lactamase class C family)